MDITCCLLWKIKYITETTGVNYLILFVTRPTVNWCYKKLLRPLIIARLCMYMCSGLQNYKDTYKNLCFLY